MLQLTHLQIIQCLTPLILTLWLLGPCSFNVIFSSKATQEIHNHINILPKIIRLLQLNAIAQPPESHTNTILMLLLPPLTPYAKMSIEDFCGQFSLSVNIIECLCANGYSGSHVIQYIKIGELQSMAFKPGEIAELKEAVHVWVTSNDTL